MNQIEISGCSRIQDVLIRYKLDDKDLAPGKIQICFEQEIEPGKCHCLWYGGDVAYIAFNGYTFYISAIGDVSLRLLLKEDSHVVASVKDRANGGIFADEMAGYIENDAMLERLFKESDPKYAFEIDETNWYEMSVEDKEGNLHYEYDTLDSELIFDAIAEVAGAMEEIINDLEKEELVS